MTKLRKIAIFSLALILHPSSPAWQIPYPLQSRSLIHAADLVRGPYVENVTPKTATVRWRTDEPATGWLEYGAVPNCSRFMTISPTAKEHAEMLFGLFPATTHCYKIYLPNEEEPGEEESEYDEYMPEERPPGKTTKLVGEGTFITFRPPESTYLNFLAFGDSGSGEDAQYELAGQMETFEPDLVIHTGDMVESGWDSDADAQYFLPYRNLLKKVPFFLALGNLDYGREWQKPAGKYFIRRNYKPIHQMTWGPGTPHYYFFDNANARFIFLDTNHAGGAIWAPPLEKDSPQMLWLEKALSRCKTQWKFVVLHHPVYSNGGHGSTKGFDSLLAPLFEKYNVDIVFQGHDHNYERTHPIKNGMPAGKSGVIYVTLGGGGRPLYIQRTHSDWSAKFLAVYHFANVEILNNSLRMKVYDKTGGVIDTLNLIK